MTKKLICVLLTILLLFAFSGCKSEKTESLSSEETYEYIDEYEKTSDSASVPSEKEKVKKEDTVSEQEEYEIITSTTGGKKKVKKSEKCNHWFSEPTCTEASVCSKCGKVSDPALGHDIIKATCTDPAKCKRCGKEISAALGHQLVKNRCTRCSFVARGNGGTALYLGDSISAGNDIAGNWCKKLETSYAIKGTNVSQSGWYLSDITDHPIVKQFEYVDPKASFDYVILHGGVNDVWYSDTSGTKFGEVSPKGTTTFDTSTVAGALENLFKTAKEKYPQSKIGYIINYFPKATHKDEAWAKFLPVAKAACEKWKIPYIYFDEIENFDDIFVQPGIEYVCDGVHPTSKGYDVLTKYIGEWMLTLK